MDEIIGEFIAETLETLEVLSGEVVAWEADPTDKSRLDAFFRFFHTVKGSCGFLNLPRFERLAHGAEDVLAAIRRGERLADPATVTAVLAVMDRIGALARGLGGEPVPDEADDDGLLDALSLRSGGFELFHRIAPAAAMPAPPREPPAPRADSVEAPAPPTPSPERPTAPPRDKAPRTIRLPLALIDQLMNGISDMVLARNDLARRMRDHGVAPDVESSFERMSTNVADLRDMISKTRMQRVDRLYAAIPRMVRDLSRELGKKVTVTLDGGDVEMDREMIEMVADPLTHIVRNALDHGLELPADRIAARKPDVGRLNIVARQSGNQIVIEVADDGRGMDRAALVDRAVAAGLVTAAEAAGMSDAEKLNLIFLPGLSTAREVTSISGRGVGMDVVRANIEQIGGVIDITTAPGDGTVITMRVPLTLTIIPGLIVRCGGQTFAMPRGNVVELIHENSAMVSVEEVAGGRIATIRGERHPVVALEDVLGLARQAEANGPRTLMVIRSSAGQNYVLGVETVDSNEELVIRPASPVIASAGAFAGMTLPDNGQPMLLLDATGLFQIAQLPVVDADKARRDHHNQEPTEAIDTLQVLFYRDRDGVERLMPLPIVERVEELDCAQIGRSEGRAFARIEERLLPALNVRPDETGVLKAMRLHDGRDLLIFLIEEVLDILEIPARLDVPIGRGRIAGLVLVGEQQLELVDPFTLFEEVAARPASDAAAQAVRCMIADVEDPWMRNILAPLLVQAGYDVVLGAAGDAPPDVVLCGSGHAPAPMGVPVLALREQPQLPADPDAPPSIYRYDRAGLMAAISSFARKAA
ncbi:MULTISPECIES: chemotaxis protein CheA [unclassified Sphingobium]|uniref:chemotaxis protein CheA n=1 Tax=unclassified Sphingobium TaxID=2611147 RepID=UPI0022244B8C|nr:MULTISPECIES: chemotaxis protein CheW [unclassified Sphingobium]MCW2410575.1 two-component system chemotaxis sensor kinase CheA [Sphingobium sp. B8D3D]MCW2413732.1 two-component system chemotaxis sensor kinase CheA [Sphingobium sp. B8D3A]